MKKQYETKLTFGIPTRYGGPALLRAAESIYNSAGKIKINFIVVSDSKPLEPFVLKGLKKLGVIVIENKTEGSQFKKIKQIVDMVKTKYLVLTQDDVIFDFQSISMLIKSINTHPNATLILPKIASFRASTIMERILEVGIRMSYDIGRLWNGGNNYLLANGRCMVFRTSKIKQFDIPETIVNGDAFFYFSNKFSGGKVYHDPNIVIFNKNPKHLDEHLNQAQRFQYSRTELEPYFKRDMSEEYIIPKSIAFKVLVNEFIKQPIFTPLYLLVNLYTKLKKVNDSIISRTSWAIAKSTKDESI